MWDRDAGVAGDQYRGAGQHVCGHQARRHGAKVGVKCSCGCRGSVDIGGKVGRDWEHGLWETKKVLLLKAHICQPNDKDRWHWPGWQKQTITGLSSLFIYGYIVERSFTRQRSRTSWCGKEKNTIARKSSPVWPARRLLFTCCAMKWIYRPIERFQNNLE